jgi:hypothetical protein
MHMLYSLLLLRLPNILVMGERNGSGFAGLDQHST